VIVILRAPTLGNRNGFESSIVVENEMVIDAPRELGFMIGWRSQMVRSYCRSVGWTASTHGK
jgi:hypothetical protein